MAYLNQNAAIPEPFLFNQAQKTVPKFPKTHKTIRKITKQQQHIR